MSGVGMLSCVVCDRAFDSAANDPAFDAVPYEGTLFYSSGHYGSTVFDPFDGTKLEIIVCDKCLKERRGRVARILPFSRPAERTTWDDYAASADTHRDGGDVKQAPALLSGAVGGSRDAQPSPDSSNA